MDEFAEFADPHQRARERPTDEAGCHGAGDDHHRAEPRLTLTVACRETGVALTTVCEWLARGRGEDPQRPRTKAYEAFGEAVKRAQDRARHARFARRRREA